ncbi:hypothetical protein [Bacillus gaemokensis]|uniref:hypothetical protein n=1 Tax=Bacillus gaemokensis TaxID=574375 RepID=UPI00068AACF1|nr:hypothetical protein [Bacillus gaemokensis]KYG37118.1 hypothetical protein AZF08_06835 [Bacillus gaemokensis]
MKKYFLLIGFTISLLGFVAKFPYRQFIYQNHISDFGLADSVPSFLFVIGMTFIIFSLSEMKKKKVAIRTIALVTAGALLYEFEQLSLNMIFDVKDVASTILGGFASFMLYKSILKKQVLRIQKEAIQT